MSKNMMQFRSLFAAVGGETSLVMDLGVLLAASKDVKIVGFSFGLIIERGGNYLSPDWRSALTLDAVNFSTINNFGLLGFLNVNQDVLRFSALSQAPYVEAGFFINAGVSVQAGCEFTVAALSAGDNTEQIVNIFYE